MDLPKNLKDEIWDYCRINNIPNIDEFTLKLIKQGFTIEKYGATPEPKEKVVEKIVEKIVEVPIEKIVDKIVEVEKIVEKEVYITDDSQAKELTDKISRLENDLSISQANYKKDVELYHEKYVKVSAELEDTIQQLAEAKKNNKRDIYGEQ